MYACCTDNTAAAQLLIEHGAEVNVESDDGTTALHVATELGVPNMVVSKAVHEYCKCVL